MNQQENNFFATQIAQKASDTPDEINNQEQSQGLPEVSVQKQQQNLHSLKYLLTAFNSFDKQQKGLITLQNTRQILVSKQINVDQLEQYHEMSLPIYENLVSFDEFLFIYCLSENRSENIQDKYALCKTVDYRLIEFLKLLNNYRKKNQRSGNYKEAKSSKKKIQDIRAREQERRNKYLKILYENQILNTQNIQRQKFQEFCAKWDLFMNQYEITASDLVKKVKEKHLQQIKGFEQKTKQQLKAKMHYSKYLLELQTRQKNLVKLQEYEKASLVQYQIEQVKARQLHQKQLADQQIVELRLKCFKKQQEASISTLLQKIQKDRNDHMKHRQTQTEKLMIRNKSQMTQIDHRYNETFKRVYEALNNLGLQNDLKSYRSKKSN